MQPLIKYFPLCVLLVTAGCLASPANDKVTIADVIAKPSKYNNTIVNLQGTISQSAIDQAASGTIFYALNFNDSSSIAELYYQKNVRIKCSDSRQSRSENKRLSCNSDLVIGQRYNITGVVSFHSVFHKQEESWEEKLIPEIHLISWNPPHLLESNFIRHLTTTFIKNKQYPLNFMKIDKKIQDALNTQINYEFRAAYQYLAMAAHFDSQELKGFANWFRKQSNEEVTHAMKIYEYVLNRDGAITLQTVPQPKDTWKSPLHVFEDSYTNEVKVTTAINGIMDLAVKQKDHATVSFLQWFVDEQVEEEDQASYYVERLKRIGADNAALVLLDQELSKRE